MISLLSKEEKSHVTKESLIELEAHIMTTLNFEFHLPGPIAPLERFVRLLDYHNNILVFDTASNICKYSLTDSRFLSYKPSEIAASAVILAINIYQKD